MSYDSLYYISSPEPGDFRAVCTACSWVGKYTRADSANEEPDGTFAGDAHSKA